MVPLPLKLRLELGLCISAGTITQKETAIFAQNHFSITDSKQQAKTSS